MFDVEPGPDGLASTKHPFKSTAALSNQKVTPVIKLERFDSCHCQATAFAGGAAQAQLHIPLFLVFS